MLVDALIHHRQLGMHKGPLNVGHADGLVHSGVPWGPREPFEGFMVHVYLNRDVRVVEGIRHPILGSKTYIYIYTRTHLEQELSWFRVYKGRCPLYLLLFLHIAPKDTLIRTPNICPIKQKTYLLIDMRVSQG